MSEPILNVTAEGNRLNDAGVIEIAQAAELLTETGTLTAKATFAPRAQTLAFAHRFFDAVSFTEEAQKQARQAEHAITSELELVQHVQHLIDVAKAAGFKFTVTLNAAGTPIPAALKA